MDVVALPFVKEDREFLLADQLRQSVGGGDVAGGQRGEGRGIDAAHVSVHGDLLAVFVDQENDFCVGVDLQTLERVLDLEVLLLVHHEIGRGHSASILAGCGTKSLAALPTP